MRGRRWIENSDRSAFASPALGDSVSEPFSLAFRNINGSSLTQAAESASEIADGHRPHSPRIA